MSVWRGRTGAHKLELLLAETLAAATRAKAVDKSQTQRVTVDTTVQTKAVAHPTDNHLLLRAIEWLNKPNGSRLPYDGHTLKDQIAQVERLTGAAVARVYVDKGYRRHGLAAPDIHITQSPSRLTPTIKRELQRRSAIEPIIGHTKSDGLLERNRLAGAKGDAINAILVGAGHNIRLLLAWLRVLLLLLLAFAASALSTRNSVAAIAPNAI